MLPYMHDPSSRSQVHGRHVNPIRRLSLFNFQVVEMLRSDKRFGRLPGTCVDESWISPLIDTSTPIGDVLIPDSQWLHMTPEQQEGRCISFCLSKLLSPENGNGASLDPSASFADANAAVDAMGNNYRTGIKGCELNRGERTAAGLAAEGWDARSPSGRPPPLCRVVRSDAIARGRWGGTADASSAQAPANTGGQRSLDQNVSSCYVWHNAGPLGYSLSDLPPDSNGSTTPSPSPPPSDAEGSASCGSSTAKGAIYATDEGNYCILGSELPPWALFLIVGGVLAAVAALAVTLCVCGCCCGQKCCVKRDEAARADKDAIQQSAAASPRDRSRWHFVHFFIFGRRGRRTPPCSHHHENAPSSAAAVAAAAAAAAAAPNGTAAMTGSTPVAVGIVLPSANGQPDTDTGTGNHLGTPVPAPAMTKESPLCAEDCESS